MLIAILKEKNCEPKWQIKTEDLHVCFSKSSMYLIIWNKIKGYLFVYFFNNPIYMTSIQKILGSKENKNRILLKKKQETNWNCIVAH